MPAYQIASTDTGWTSFDLAQSPIPYLYQGKLYVVLYRDEFTEGGSFVKRSAGVFRSVNDGVTWELIEDSELDSSWQWDSTVEIFSFLGSEVQSGSQICLPFIARHERRLGLARFELSTVEEPHIERWIAPYSGGPVVEPYSFAATGGVPGGTTNASGSGLCLRSDGSFVLFYPNADHDYVPPPGTHFDARRQTQYAICSASGTWANTQGRFIDVYEQNIITFRIVTACAAPDDSVHFFFLRNLNPDAGFHDVVLKHRGLDSLNNLGSITTVLELPPDASIIGQTPRNAIATEIDGVPSIALPFTSAPLIGFAHASIVHARSESPNPGWQVEIGPDPDGRTDHVWMVQVSDRIYTSYPVSGSFPDYAGVRIGTFSYAPITGTPVWSEPVPIETVGTWIVWGAAALGTAIGFVLQDRNDGSMWFLRHAFTVTTGTGGGRPRGRYYGV